jgi:hypothetical protein
MLIQIQSNPIQSIYIIVPRSSKRWLRLSLLVYTLINLKSIETSDVKLTQGAIELIWRVSFSSGVSINTVGGGVDRAGDNY